MSRGSCWGCQGHVTWWPDMGMLAGTPHIHGTTCRALQHQTPEQMEAQLCPTSKARRPMHNQWYSINLDDHGL